MFDSGVHFILYLSSKALVPTGHKLSTKKVSVKRRKDTHLEIFYNNNNSNMYSPLAHKGMMCRSRTLDSTIDSQT